MKKIMPFMALLTIAILVIPTYAEKPVQKMEIVNTPDKPIPVKLDDGVNVNVVSEPATPRDVNIVSEPDTDRNVFITNPDPIPVTIVDGAAQKEFVSTYLGITSNDDMTIMTVPVDKQFIMTDIVYFSWTNQVGFLIKENTSIKIHAGFAADVTGEYTHPLHFYSGIPFAAGSQIIVQANPGDITISGYLIDL